MTPSIEHAVDYGQFAARLAAPRASRWELLSEVQREWGFEPDEWEPDEWDPDLWEDEDDEEDEDEDDEDEELRVDPNLSVPLALREWWTWPENTFMANARWYWTHPEMPPTLRPDPGGWGVAGAVPDGSPLLPPGGDRRVCVFMAEYQYCNEWGYAAAEAGQDDPRVLVSVGDDEGWAVQDRSVSEYFLHLALIRLPFRLGWTLRVSQEQLDRDPAALGRLTAAYPDMGLLPWRELGSDIVLRGGPDLIVRHDRADPEDVLLLAGRTEAAVREAAALLGAPCKGSDPEPPRD
ncbi:MULTISPECIES: hypothetical protein [Streptomyces]|uniref:SMI1/KNR4 family protein n=1 Tax=Streptomyces fuscus TaxID=3048495 RepID=A0ABT7IWX1_9ACTN|nr:MULTISPECIES: hypothetical protein [Streptomyces]MCM1975645.1 hypothetical protein [Streptomyces sp. G1]MDL2077078.1 hypothetical protein [Streptomyces fuscus]SBT95932.1 hypothetical protein GA0115233_11905 [Streptomyces sp. DI166]